MFIFYKPISSIMLTYYAFPYTINTYVVDLEESFMKYPRYAYNDPAAPTFKVKTFIGGHELTMPKYDYPITPKENFTRSINRNKPMWVPNPLLDFQIISPNDMILSTDATIGQNVSMDFSTQHTGDYRFTDWFLTDWSYVHSAGGPMLTPGFFLCEDVTEWKKDVKFPDFSDWDWDTFRDDFMSNRYDPNKILHVDIGLGCSERLVSIMGGYGETMLAFAAEPDACRDFFEAFIDHEIEFFDKIMDNYPIDLLTYHDDWCNERDAFFSPAMLEYMLLGPTKRFIDHVKLRGVFLEFHICGNMMRFLPYFNDLDIDLLQIQRRAVDFPLIKEKYGDKLGFGTGIEGFLPGAAEPTADQLISMVRKTIDMYAARGGVYSSFYLSDPELLWIGTNELYAYSREFYDNEN